MLPCELTCGARDADGEGAGLLLPWREGGLHGETRDFRCVGRRVDRCARRAGQGRSTARWLLGACRGVSNPGAGEMVGL